jgi:O-antigen/teichoic acid export membrane protein
MGIVQKQGLSITVISFIGVIIGAINTLFIFPNVLGAEKHGLVMLFLSIATIISQFAHLGIPNTLIRFFPFFKDRKKFIYRLALQVPVMSVALLFLMFYLFGAELLSTYNLKNQLFLGYQEILIPLVGSLVFFEVLLSISRSELKTVFPAVLRELGLRVFTLILLVLYFVDWIDFTVFIYAWLGMYSLNVFFLALYLFNLKFLKVELGFPLFPNADLSKKMRRYGLVTLLTSSAAILVNRIDVLMLGHYINLENISYYTVAFFMASLIHIPARSILQIVKPLLANAWAENHLEEIALLYKKTALNQMLIGLLLFIGIWMNLDDILLFLSKEYSDIQMVFFYIGLAKLIDVSVGVNGAIISTSNKFKYDLYINLFLIIVTIVSNMIFIPIYGIDGAAMATALALLIHNTIKTIVVYKCFSIQPFSSNSIKLIVIGLVTYFILLLIPFAMIESTLLRIVVRSLCITALYMGAMLFFAISVDMNNQIKNILKR